MQGKSCPSKAACSKHPMHITNGHQLADKVRASQPYLGGQSAGVIRDDGKVVQGVQKPDTSWKLIRVGSK